MLEQLINHFFKYEFVYVFIFLTVLVMMLVIVTKIEALKKILLSLMSVFFVFFIIEYSLSLKTPLRNSKFIKETISVVFKQDFDISKLNTERHLRYDFNGQQYHFYNTDFIKKDKDNRIFVYNVYETTYQNVFRYTECNFDAEKNYVFLGCSFIYGLGLEDNQTLPYLFCELSKFKIGVLNSGFTSTASNSALNILQSNVVGKFIKQDKKIKHFVYLAIPDHIERNFRNEVYKDIPSDNYIYEKGEFVRIKQPFGIFVNNLECSHIFRKIFLNIIVNKNRIFYEDYFINSLLKMNDIIEKKYNSKFTVLLWTDKKMKFDEKFLEKLKSTKLDILMLPEFDDNYVIPHDGHPNEKANRKIAELLLKHFEEQDKKYEK